MTNIYDKTLPMDYHFLNLHYREKSIDSKSMLVNGTMLTNKTWSVFKAATAISDYHFKNSDEKNITIYFTTDWLEKKFKGTGNWDKNKFKIFMNSANKNLLVTEENDGSNNFYNEFLRLTRLEDRDTKRKVLDKVNREFFEYFIQILSKEIFSEDYFKLEDNDRKQVKFAENILVDNLLNEFPGIELIAKKVGVSPTKLKTNFKTIHNKT